MRAWLATIRTRSAVLLAFGLVMTALLGPAAEFARGQTCTLTIKDESTVGGNTKNVGQEVVLRAEIDPPAPTALVAWTVPGTTILSYDESVSGKWSPTDTEETDRLFYYQNPIWFFWKDTGASRQVTAGTGHPNGATCSDAKSFDVERNKTDPARQPEDFYTSCCKMSPSQPPIGCSESTASGTPTTPAIPTRFPAGRATPARTS